MVLENQECYHSRVALSVLIKKERQIFFEKNGFIYIYRDRLFKRGFEWYFGAEPAYAALSSFHRQKFARTSWPFADAKAGCVCKGGRDAENKKKLKRKQTKSQYFNKNPDLTHLYFPLDFQHVLENDFTFSASCVKPQTWLCTQRHTPVLSLQLIYNCSHHGLNFNPLVQPDEVHEPSSADSSWLRSFCFACFVVWASNVPALPSAHTFGFWLMRGLRQGVSVCHVKSSMSSSQVVTQIPQTVYRIDHKFLQ